MNNDNNKCLNMLFLFNCHFRLHHINKYKHRIYQKVTSSFHDKCNHKINIHHIYKNTDILTRNYFNKHNRVKCKECIIGLFFFSVLI